MLRMRLGKDNGKEIEHFEGDLEVCDTNENKTREDNLRPYFEGPKVQLIFDLSWTINVPYYNIKILQTKRISVFV